eukprot:2087024-Amphidinium_carterae.1
MPRQTKDRRWLTLRECPIRLPFRENDVLALGGAGTPCEAAGAAWNPTWEAGGAAWADAWAGGATGADTGAAWIPNWDAGGAACAGAWCAGATGASTGADPVPKHEPAVPPFADDCIMTHIWSIRWSKVSTCFRSLSFSMRSSCIA